MSNKRRKCEGPLVSNITDYEEEFRKYNIQLNPNDVNDSKELFQKCSELIDSWYFDHMLHGLVSVCELCKIARNLIESFLKCIDCGVRGCKNCVLHIERITIDHGICYICLNKRVQRYNKKRKNNDFSYILQELKKLTYFPPELWNIVFYYAYCVNMRCYDCNPWEYTNKLF